MASDRPQIAQRLVAEKVRYMDTLETLGNQLRDSLPLEVCEGSTTPSRDWCRAFSRYQTGLNDLTNEQLKHAQLQLLAQRAGQGALTDEDYEAGLAELSLEAVKAMDRDVLQKLLAERGLRVEDVPDDEGEEP